MFYGHTERDTFLYDLRHQSNYTNWNQFVKFGVSCFTQGHNDECMFGNLDALEKQRDMVSMRLTNYQQKLAQKYNKKVRPQEFVPGDLVQWKVVESMKDQSPKKLAPN